MSTHDSEAAHHGYAADLVPPLGEAADAGK